MPRYLLLGAGFSRNWGGWLASEVADDLIWRVRARSSVRELLMRMGFEDAFQDLRSRFSHDGAVLEDLLNLQNAVDATFRAMNQSFADLFGVNSFTQPIIDFLSRFDAIFTLNQDLLLEMHYPNDGLANRARWDGLQWPGIPPRTGAAPIATPMGKHEMLTERRIPEQAMPALDARMQPILNVK